MDRPVGHPRRWSSCAGQAWDGGGTGHLMINLCMCRQWFFIDHREGS